MSLEYRVLGPVEALVDGTPVRLGGPHQRAVLALLLAHPGETLPASRLIHDLWGAEPPETAPNVLQGFVSDLRKSLGKEAIVTRGNAYAIELEPGALDLERFERLAAEGSEALATGRPADAASGLNAALELWRGPALADLAGEEAVRPIAARWDELRLTVLERRIDADLACGRHVEVVAELQGLVAEHPLREHPCAQLMLALYRSGRQAEALEAFREARRRFVDELGLEPSRALQELERAILRQDAVLDLETSRPGTATASLPAGTLLVTALEGTRLDALLSVAEPLARRSGRSLVVARLLGPGGELAGETAVLAGHRAALASRGVDCRVVAYTSAEPGAEAALLASEHGVDLILVDAPPSLVAAGQPDAPLAAILAGAPCDVGVLVADTRLPPEGGGPVVTPFGGGEHDWAAIELAAWIASAVGTSLRLVGTKADPVEGRRDASRLLGRASLLVQEVVGIVTEPTLVAAGAEGVLSALGDASLVVLGLSERWRDEGLGAARLAVVRDAGLPALLVRRGLRPGGIVPTRTDTRFTWTRSGS